MKHFVLVAGYPQPPKSLPFRAYCENRVRRLVAANKAREDLVFQIMDVGSGEVVVRTFTYPGGNRTESVAAVRAFRPVTRALYNGNAFGDGHFDVMSAMDVYAAVSTIGVRAPGTLRELSFFSHGFAGGPVLVDSWDDGQWQPPGSRYAEVVPSGRRDPDDRDPRTKDFQPANMDPAALAALQAAYHPDGFNWSWGCAFGHDFNQVLAKVEHHPDYRSAGLADSQVLVLGDLPPGPAAVLGIGLGRVFPDPRRIEVTFGEIRQFVRREILGSYSHALAVASRRKTFGALLGTYAEPDTGARPLMHVNSAFTRHFTFYKNYFGFTFDPESRRYGGYEPDFG
ncbi:hypothetical protein [Streptomyces cinerochromogenes]|uniref:hypothetical protein n=1 Tax=Streptomyces cinerochromogenes TaxID=66422 RepID=UPI00166F8632|nr:hypothetical protein [Streptomyces cinerochromogenes]GGS58042.1 hypothetical protein GCM10010206_19830 [Streptomyces cinerochromogenes]